MWDMNLSVFFKGAVQYGENEIKENKKSQEQRKQI